MHLLAAARHPWLRRAQPRRTDPALTIGTLVLAIASFVAAVGLGRELFAVGVHLEWNLLFDADPLVYLKNFATGRTEGEWGGRSFIRPNLTNFVHLPLRALSEFLAWLPLGLAPAEELRQQMAFFVCPLVAALRVPVLVLLLRSLGLSTRGALMLAALDAASFSTRLFASIPESHMVTGTLLAAVFWLGIRTARSTALPNVWVWLLALFVLGGTSVISIVPGAMIFFAAARQFPWPRRLGITGALAGGAFALNALFYEASRAVVYTNAPEFHPVATDHLEDAWNPGVERIPDYVASLANAYLPPAPTVKPESGPANRRDFVFTFERTRPGGRPWDARPLAFLALIALGAASYIWLPAALRPVHLTALAILLFGAMLHAFFGRELFLYAHHWKVAVMVLVAGLFYLPGLPRVLTWGLPLVILAMAVSNVGVLQAIVRTLART